MNANDLAFHQILNELGQLYYDIKKTIFIQVRNLKLEHNSTKGQG